MTVKHLSPSSIASSGHVIALHCSGSTGRQWQALGDTLSSNYEFSTPEHFGGDSSGPWTGRHAFTLEDEAARTIDLIDNCDNPIHLVGHSYGGAVAMHVALARPHRIASMTLYEPSAFYLLKQMDAVGAAGLAEITSIARATCSSILCGDYQSAASLFVDYWNGKGAWNAMSPSAQAAILRWTPKASLEFWALINDTTPANAFARLRFPVMIMCGEYAPPPTRLVAGELSQRLPNSKLSVVFGAGHMGPVTHPETVNAEIAKHVTDTHPFLDLVAA